MKFVCDKDILDSCLNTVAKAVDPANVKELLRGIKIDAEDTVLTFFATDNEISLETFAEATVKEKGSLVIDGRIFSDIIKRMPEGNITFETVSQSEVMISGGEVSLSLLYLSSEGFPKMDRIEDGRTFNIYSKDLKNVIKYTVFAPDAESSMPILNGIKFEIKNSNMRAIGLNRYRMALRNQIIPDTGIDYMEFIAPAKTLAELNKILKEDSTVVRISLKDEAVMFEFDRTTVVTRLLEGEFIDYDRLIPKESKIKFKADYSKIAQSVDRASVIINYDDPKIPVIFDIKNGYLNIDCFTKRGQIHDKISIDTDGELKIGLGAKLLTDAIRAIDTNEIYFEFKDEKSPCKIMPVEGDGFLYIIQPRQL